jgi:hypothetical protein
MWTEPEFYGFLEQYGIPVTDAIREEVARDQGDPAKWCLAPARLSNLCEPDPDQSRAEQQRAFLVENAKTYPTRRSWKPATGEVKEHYSTADEIAVTALRWKAGVDPTTVLVPQLHAQREYVEAFIKQHLT